MEKYTLQPIILQESDGTKTTIPINKENNTMKLSFIWDNGEDITSLEFTPLVPYTRRQEIKKLEEEMRNGLVFRESQT